MQLIKDRPYLVAIVLIVLVILIGGGFYLTQSDPLVKMNALGGQAFFEDPKMVEYAQSKGYSINVLTNSNADSYPQKGHEDYNGKNRISLIQAGSINSKQEMSVKFSSAPYNLKPGEMPGSNGPVKMIQEYIIGTTPMMLWAKDDAGYFGLLQKAGFFDCQGDNCYISPEKTHVLVQATIDQSSWKSIGVNGIYGNVSIGFPTGSGGRATAAMLLSCWKPDQNGEFCTRMITPEEMATDEYKNAFLALYAAGGQIPAGDDSLKIGINWFPLNSSVSPTVLLAATESSYVTWLNGLTDNQQKAVPGMKIHGVYFVRPIVTTFTVICLDDPCQKFFGDAVNDPAFQKIMSDDEGVRTASFTSAPTFVGKFIDPSPRFQPMQFPFSLVTSKINEYINAYGK